MHTWETELTILSIQDLHKFKNQHHHQPHQPLTISTLKEEIKKSSDNVFCQQKGVNKSGDVIYSGKQAPGAPSEGSQ